MRVAHVITRLIIGGAQENTITTVLGLLEQPNVQVHLISGPSTGPEGSLEHRLAHVPHVLHIMPELVRPLHPVKDLVCLFRLERLLRRLRPDIVHTHSGKAGILGRWAAFRARAPVIVHTIHGPSFGPFQGLLPNLLYTTAERITGKITTHFVSVADAMTSQYVRAGIGTPDKYTTIRSGFDLEPYNRTWNDPQLRVRLGLAPEDFVVGKIARLVKLKGHEDLIEVAPRLLRTHPRLRFLLVGDGHLKARLQSKICAAGLQNAFVFAGLVPPEQIPAYVGIMDCLVHLSRREGLAKALPQALAAGKPVVAYDCDGAGEVCINGETGFLITPGDLAGLANAISTLASNPDLRARMGATGRELVRAQFDARKMVNEIYHLYVRLLERPRHA